MSEKPQKGYRPGVYRLVSGTVTGDVWSADQGSGIPQEGFNPGVIKTLTVSVNPDESTTPDSDDPGIYRTVNGFVTNNVYSNQEQPEEGFIPGVFKSAPDGNPVPREGFIRGQAGVVIGSISNGKWRGSPSISNASTTNIAGGASASSISFDLTGCLYVTGSNLNSLGSLFTYYLDSGSGPVEILKTSATFSPTPDGITIPQRWRVNFGSTTIGDARGDTDQFWKDGDILTMELKPSFASLLQIRPDCVFDNINEATDLFASPIGITPVVNLYSAPTILSVSVSNATPNMINVVFNTSVESATVDPTQNITIGSRDITPIAAPAVYGTTMDFEINPPMIGGFSENFVVLTSILQRVDTQVKLADTSILIANNIAQRVPPPEGKEDGGSILKEDGGFVLLEE